MATSKLNVDPTELARQEASLRSIAGGGLPLAATERLEEQAKRPTPFFSSDLSASELMLTRECGFQAVGQVMGSAVFQIGLQYMPAVSGELKVLTDAHMQARHKAMNRLSQEATILGADGVVGVRIVRKEIDAETRLTEFMAIGTAVKKTESGGKAREPFLSALSGQEHWSLGQAGYRPVGFAFGICTYYQAPDWRNNSNPGAFQNKEYTYLTQGIYVCREIASERMAEDCRRLSGAGVVGVKVETSTRSAAADSGPAGLLVHFTAFGTAIVQQASSAGFAISPTISLKD